MVSEVLWTSQREAVMLLLMLFSVCCVFIYMDLHGVGLNLQLLKASVNKEGLRIYHCTKFHSLHVQNVLHISHLIILETPV
jgi:hypothetical protein